MFAKNRDYKAELEAKEEEIAELRHVHHLDIARIQREHDTNLLSHKAKINELEDKYGVLQDLQETHAGLKKRELDLAEHTRQQDDREAILDIREQGIEDRRELAQENLKTQEANIANRESNISIKENQCFLDGKTVGRAVGYGEGFEAATELHLKASDRTHSLLTLHALTPSQQVVANGEKEESESSKILADAFAKHLTKTVDKLLEDDEDDE